MLNRNYFARQAAILLRLAQQTKDPALIATLIDKATELKSQADLTIPPPDETSLAPDVSSQA